MSSPAPMEVEQQQPAYDQDQVFGRPASPSSDISSDDETPAPAAAAQPETSASTPPPAGPEPSSPQAAAESPEAAAPEDGQDAPMAGSDDDGASSAGAGSRAGSDAGDGEYDGGEAGTAGSGNEGADASGSVPNFKKSGAGGGGGKSGESSGRKKKKRRKNSPSPEREASPVPEMTEDEIRRAQLEKRIDAIIKKPAARRKRKNDGDDDLDQMADDMIQALKDRMLDAADRDEVLSREGRDATAKESMLQDVVNVLQQSTLLQSIVDNDLLSAVRRWLEPLPDRTLPSLGIQTAFLEILVKMDIDTPTLKSCGLGKIIVFYTKSRRSTLRVKRLAERLQLNWLRPLVKSSSSYRTKVVHEVDVKDRKPLPRFKTLTQDREKRDESMTPGGERSEIKAQSIGNKRRGARIPMNSSLAYTVAPRFDSQTPSQSSQGGNPGAQEADQQKRQRDAERMRNIKKRLNEARRQEKT